MTWFNKFRLKSHKTTIDDLMDDILSDALVKLEMKLIPIGFSKINSITRTNYRYKLDFKCKLKPLLSHMTVADKNIFWNTRRNLLGKYSERNPPTILKYKHFYVCLYRYRHKYHAFSLSEELGLFEISEIIDIDTENIHKFLGNLNDSNLKEFRRNNLIDDLLL